MNKKSRNKGIDEVLEEKVEKPMMPSVIVKDRDTTKIYRDVTEQVFQQLFEN